MNEGKDDGVGESEAPSAHPREAKARTGYGFPQRTDERSVRSFIGLCVMRLPFDRRSTCLRLPASFVTCFSLIDTVNELVKKSLNINKNLSLISYKK